MIKSVGISMAPYNRAFFEETEAASSAAAEKVLSSLRRLHPFRSLLDVGCGTGNWLACAKNLGAERVLGVDGPHVPRDQRRVSSDAFLEHDLETCLPDVGRFDLTICLEVAEHLRPARGPSLVADLVRTSDVVAFSAAIPFQGGDGHLNEMWPSYWGQHFKNHGYLPWTGLRNAIWREPDIPWWYRQNLILFVAEPRWGAFFGNSEPAANASLDVVHPECYLWSARRADSTLVTSIEQDVAIYRRLAAGLPVEPPGYGPEFPAPSVYGRQKLKQF